MVEMPFQRIDEISEKVERLTAEIEALRKRLAK
jgi:molecular chaperone GrpE (heat shock protein)